MPLKLKYLQFGDASIHGCNIKNDNIPVRSLEPGMHAIDLSRMPYKEWQDSSPKAGAWNACNRPVMDAISVTSYQGGGMPAKACKGQATMTMFACWGSLGFNGLGVTM